MKLSKISLLGSLYLSQVVPVMFLMEAVPTVMRSQEFSLQTIGLFALMLIPKGLYFLWSPMVDRYGFTRLGHYRTWIISCQLTIAFLTALLAFLNITENITALFAATFLMMVLCATQDIATDALAIGSLTPAERSEGSAIQLIGNAIGTMIAGGGLMIALNRLGWTSTLLMLALFMVIALIPIVPYQEVVSIPQARQSYFKTFLTFLHRPETKQWLLILLMLYAGSMMTNTMFRPFLIDLGWTFEEIGWLMGILPGIASSLGAIVASRLINQWGRMRSLILFGTVFAGALLLYCLPAIGYTAKAFIYAIVLFTQLVYGMVTATASTVMMDYSRQENAGSDYTLQTSFVFLGGLSAASISGTITQASNYQTLFVISSILTAIAVFAIAKFLPVFNELKHDR